jgi:hypothetical protein
MALGITMARACAKKRQYRARQEARVREGHRLTLFIKTLTEELSQNPKRTTLIPFKGNAPCDLMTSH